MTKQLFECMDKAKSYLDSTQKDYQITAVYDLGDSYLFAWEIGESIMASDNFSIEVNKETKEASLFILPDDRNFERLEAAVEVPYE